MLLDVSGVIVTPLLRTSFKNSMQIRKGTREAWITISGPYKRGWSPIIHSMLVYACECIIFLSRGNQICRYLSWWCVIAQWSVQAFHHGVGGYKPNFPIWRCFRYEQTDGVAMGSPLDRCWLTSSCAHLRNPRATRSIFVILPKGRRWHLDHHDASPVPELSFLPAPYRGSTRARETRVQDNLHAHAQSEPIKKWWTCSVRLSNYICTREVTKHERSVRVARGDSRVRL